MKIEDAMNIKYCFLLFSSMFIMCGCYQIADWSIQTGISTHCYEPEREAWSNLKIGFFVFDKEKNAYEKQVCEIDDPKILQKLQASFHIISAEPCGYKPSGWHNLMFLKLRNGEEWKLAFPMCKDVMIIDSSDSKYSIKVKDAFYQQLKDYLENRTGKRVEFYLNVNDYRVEGFRYIHFGEWAFCFWINKNRSNINTIMQRSDFYFEAVSSNPYVRKKLQDMGIQSQDIDHTYLVYSNQDGSDFSKKMTLMPFENTVLYRLAQCAIAEKAIVLIQSAHRPHPLVLCLNEESLAKTAKSQCLGGYLSVIFNPSGEDISYLKIKY